MVECDLKHMAHQIHAKLVNKIQQTAVPAIMRDSLAVVHTELHVGITFIGLPFVWSLGINGSVQHRGKSM